ncbi:MAG: malonyl-CoA synthase [Gammaproteobacteria bacterium]|nr:malonyl-CoA synthase [Gammaproteobacteria bacterium]
MNDYNVYRHFSRNGEARAERELLQTADGRTWSWRETDEASARVARYLTELGVQPGERVSVQVEKSPEALMLYLACLRGGFVFHPLNTAYQPGELEYFLGNAEPAVFVCDPSKAGDSAALAVAAGVRHRFTLDAAGTGTLIDGCRDVSPVFDTVTSAKDDLAALLYSSGTTGVPKGIMLTHGNLLANTRSLVDAWGFTEADRLLHALPVFHVHGLFVAIGCVMLSGASMRWLPTFNAGTVLEFLPECSVMMGVPTYYTRLLADERLTAERCNNVRVFISGSAPLLEETFRDFEQRTGHRILERYGMSETNMNTSNPLHGERKPGTVGPPLPGVEVRIVDDAGSELPAGEIGNLQVRGDNVFVGYWKLPDKTAEDFTDDGWFNTGDKGRIDENGYVAIIGRSKDMVITGGLNVYPKEVELFIDDLPGVKESAIIGVPHPDFGEGVVAVVVADGDDKPSEADIIAAAAAELANFKVPKRVMFVDKLPRNTMAKVQKNVLRDNYRDLFQ